MRRVATKPNLRRMRCGGLAAEGRYWGGQQWRRKGGPHSASRTHVHADGIKSAVHRGEIVTNFGCFTLSSFRTSEANFLSIYESVMTQCPSGWNPSWVGQEDPEAEGGRLSQASLQLHCGAAAKPPGESWLDGLLWPAGWTQCSGQTRRVALMEHLLTIGNEFRTTKGRYVSLHN